MLTEYSSYFLIVDGAPSLVEQCNRCICEALRLSGRRARRTVKRGAPRGRPISFNGQQVVQIAELAFLGADARANLSCLSSEALYLCEDFEALFTKHVHIRHSLRLPIRSIRGLIARIKHVVRHSTCQDVSHVVRHILIQSLATGFALAGHGSDKLWRYPRELVLDVDNKLVNTIGNFDRKMDTYRRLIR